MLNNLGKFLTGVLAFLGVLFIVLMLLPEDEGSESAAAATEVMAEAAEETEISGKESIAPEEEAENTEDETSDNGNRVKVNIPESELSEGVIVFESEDIERKKVTQDIFGKHDITCVLVWGTYCETCIEDMYDYAEFYKEKPENLNLTAIVCDVYEGIDSNVKKAEEILKDADAGFTNIRVSDSVLDLIADLPDVPSAFFVDREGHLIGEVLNGAGFGETIKALDRYIE